MRQMFTVLRFASLLLCSLSNEPCASSTPADITAALLSLLNTYLQLGSFRSALELPIATSNSLESLKLVKRNLS
jgi:hypothetical protein